MKKYNKEVGFGLLLLVIFAGLILWAIFTKPQESLAVFIAIVVVIIAAITFAAQVLKKRADLQTGAPADDEFTRLARVYAGSRAFTYSMYLWLLIFVFNSAFTKPQTMLGIGILGSALIYGLWLLYFRSTAQFYAE